MKSLLDSGQSADPLAPIVNLLMDEEEGGLFIPLFMANATYLSGFPYLCEKIDMDGISDLRLVHPPLTTSIMSDQPVTNQTGVGFSSAAGWDCGSSTASSQIHQVSVGGQPLPTESHDVIVTSQVTRCPDNKLSIRLVVGPSGTNRSSGGSSPWRCCLKSAAQDFYKMLRCGHMVTQVRG